MSLRAGSRSLCLLCLTATSHALADGPARSSNNKADARDRNDVTNTSVDHAPRFVIVGQRQQVVDAESDAVDQSKTTAHAHEGHARRRQMAGTSPGPAGSDDDRARFKKRLTLGEPP